jgi:hypothetical protein
LEAIQHFQPLLQRVVVMADQTSTQMEAWEGQAAEVREELYRGRQGVLELQIKVMLVETLLPAHLVVLMLLAGVVAQVKQVAMEQQVLAVKVVMVLHHLLLVLA